MTGTILAGGENRRIPLLKGHIEINGERLVDSALKTLRNFFNKAVISTNLPELYFYCGLPMIGDISRQRGPLTGIFSVLSCTGDDAIFVVACDMPFINTDIISLLISHHSLRGDKKDAVIPVFDGRPQPLFGIYSKSGIGIMEKRLREERRSIIEMLTELNVLYIKEAEVREIDPTGRSFVNINTMEDLEKVRGGRICLG